MRIFRFALILAAGTVLQAAPLSQPAAAADLPPSLKDTPFVVVPSWEGFYFGGHLGGAISNTGVNDTFTYVGDPNFNGSLSNTGLMAGAQAGYNFQRGHFVFGVEGDIGYLSVSGSQSANGLTTKNGTCQDAGGSYSGEYCMVDAKYSSSGGMYGDLTGRLGYAADRTLLYLKGGVAFLNEDFKAHYDGHNCNYVWDCGGAGYQNAPSQFDFSQSSTLVGWTIGAGAEYALTPSVSLKAEYQHFDFGSMSYSYSGCTPVPGVVGANCATSPYWFTSRIKGNTDVSVTADAVSLGVNYHFNNDGLK